MKPSCSILATVVLLSSGVRHSRAPLELSARSILEPISTTKPDSLLYPEYSNGFWPAANSDIQGPKHTNKFWTTWAVDGDGSGGMSIYPAPYTLRFERVGDSPSGSVNIMKGETDYQGSFAVSHWHPDFRMGAVEGFSGSHKIVKEEHFGVHVRVFPSAGSTCTMTHIVYSGMAYPTAHYGGACTPKITSQFDITSINKVRAGVWQFKRRFDSVKEYRVYLVTDNGNPVDNSYDFDSNGVLNKQTNDVYLRFAHVQQSSDAEALDAYARVIMVGMSMDIEDGKLHYKFDTVGPSNGKVLHWLYANHMHFLASGAKEDTGLTQTMSPVKGLMRPIVGGSVWTFEYDLSDALALDFLPAGRPSSERAKTIYRQLDEDWEYYKENWRLTMHIRDYYFSGKGFQKIGMLCLMMAERDGVNGAKTQECANILKQGFQCLYDRSVSDGSDRDAPWPNQHHKYQEVGCLWAPYGTHYDPQWGGTPSRWNNGGTCGVDFGNSCYNDHHYHFGYYVTSGAILVHLIPDMKYEAKFVDLINTFIRDVANPSLSDPYFPQFRSFDFFDMHSWSRGLAPNPDGKDQESTSEEVNFHYGLMKWGEMIGNSNMKKVGATCLTLSSRALQDFFLMKRDNPNHPASLSIYHVTGIYFQNKITRATWFGGDPKYIHGIQMLPLSPALQFCRKADFAHEEWCDQLQGLSVDLTDPWWTVMYTGNVAFHDPQHAFDQLRKMDSDSYDDGLTKSWALYWTAVQQAEGGPYTECAVDAEPAPGSGPAPGPVPGPGAVYCNPNTNPPQFCLGGQQCPPSGVCP